MNSNQNLKIIIVGLVVLLGISLFYNPFNKSVETPVINASSKVESTVPLTTLDINLIKKMVANYKSNQLRLVEVGLKKPDAQSIWFDLKSLKNFISQIEQNTNRNDAKIGIDQIGVRMYYASYPNKEEMATSKNLKSIPKEYEKMHTLIMIPTIKINSANLDYNPLDVMTYKGGLKSVEKYGFIKKAVTDQKSDSKMLVALTVETDIAAKNHGTLSPPEDESSF